MNVEDDRDSRSESTSHSESTGPGASGGSLDRIAHYQVEALIHRGEAASVYRAIDETLERRVALKVLGDSDSAQGLIQEARTVSQLKHPSIAGVYQAGRDAESGFHFIAFEWVEGQTLRARLRNGALSLREFYRVGAAIGGAVAHAHENGRVHGDLKADNVVLTEVGEVKLLDFGLSTPAGGAPADELWGTPAYMAPELFSGSDRDESADLFALGVLFFEMVTGVLPFGGEDGDEKAVYRQLKEGISPDPRQYAPELPAPIVTVVQSLLSSDPQRRGPGAAELARLLRLRATPEAGRSRRRVLRALLWLGVITVLLSWGFRDRWWPGLSGGPDGSQGPVVLDTKTRVTQFVDPASDEVTSVSAFGADLVNLFLHGVDPGSALLVETSSEGARFGQKFAGKRGSNDKSVRPVRGRWGEVDGQWQVEWSLGGAETDASLVLRHADPVQLARQLAERLTEGTSQAVATTLCESERGLFRFVNGVRQAGEGELEAAREEFVAAQREGKYFPEAQAWEATILLLQGRHDYALNALKPLREITSQPAGVLNANLAVPRLDSSARWGANHGVAQELDLLLDWEDPRTPDEELRDRLAESSAVEWSNQHIRASAFRKQALLALRSGSTDPETSAKLLFFGGASWHGAVLRRWRLHLEGKPDQGDEELNDWLLDVLDSTPGSFLRIPYQLSRSKLGRAAQLARRKNYLAPAARPASALTLAIAGEFDEARRAARTIQDPFDPSGAERRLAAIAWLEGEEAKARQAIARARSLDRDHPENVFLEEYLKSDPYQVASPAGDPASSFGRWRSRFEILAEARALRVAGKPDDALSRLHEIQWVALDLRVIEWPELGYLAWLERIECLQDQGLADGAREEFGKFREWWPSDRPAVSRVSRRAAEVEARL